MGSINNYHIDHIDQNPLNNTRTNLRHVTISENNQNKGKRKNCSSKYIGVSYDKNNNKWSSRFAKKRIDMFNDEESAAKAYDAYILINNLGFRNNGFFKSIEDLKNIDIDTIIPEKMKSYKK